MTAPQTPPPDEPSSTSSPASRSWAHGQRGERWCSSEFLADVVVPLRKFSETVPDPRRWGSHVPGRALGPVLGVARVASLVASLAEATNLFSAHVERVDVELPTGGRPVVVVYLAPGGDLAAWAAALGLPAPGRDARPPHMLVAEVGADPTWSDGLERGVRVVVDQFRTDGRLSDGSVAP